MLSLKALNQMMLINRNQIRIEINIQDIAQIMLQTSIYFSQKVQVYYNTFKRIICIITAMQQNQSIKRSSSPSYYNPSTICCDTINDKDNFLEIIQKLFNRISLDKQIKLQLFQKVQLLQKENAQINQNFINQIKDNYFKQCNICKIFQQKIQELNKKLKNQSKETRQNIRKQYDSSLIIQKEKSDNLEKQNSENIKRITILQKNINQKEQKILILQKFKLDSSLLMKKLNKVVLNIEEKIKESQLNQKIYEQNKIDKTQLNIVKASVNEKIFKEQVLNLEKLLKIFEFVHYELKQSSLKDARIKQIQKKNEDLKKLLKEKQEVIQSKQKQIVSFNKDMDQFNKIINQNCSQTNQWKVSNLKQQLAEINQANKLKKASQSLQIFCQKSYKNYQFQKNKSINLAKKICQLEKQIDLKQQQIMMIKMKLQNLQKQKDQEINTLKKNKEQQAQKHQKKVKKLNEQKIKEIKKLDEQKDEEINLIKQNMRKKEQNYIQKIKRSQNVIVELEKQKYQKQKLCAKLQKEKSQIQLKVKKISMEMSQIKEQDKRYKKEVEREHETKNAQLKQIQDLNKNLNEKLCNVRSENNQLNIKNGNLMRDYEKAKNQIENLHQKYYLLQSQLLGFFKEISQVQYLFPNIKQEVNQANISSVISQIKYQIFNLLNSSPVLSESAILDYKKDKTQINFIKNSVQVFKKAKISGCQLVYRKDQQKSNVNFHAYIDGVQNLLLIIHLANNRIIGGFTSKPFIKNNTQKHTQGFLYVADTQTTYFMKPEGKQAITYDQYYIIWGNSQIRIRFGEDIVFSNFGILNSYYDNKKGKIQDFLGFGNQREINMNTFEFYKIKF